VKVQGNGRAKILTPAEISRLFDRGFVTARDRFLFPGREGTKPLTRSQADLIFKEACKRVRIKGASTHSMRRTALTNLSNAGVPLRVIMEISGHKNLSSLQRYLEVQPEQLVKALGILK
jgi:integrase/recombinase XerD